MDELFLVLSILGLIVAVVTVVGHLQWIFFAWVFRGFKRRPDVAARLREKVDQLRAEDRIDAPTRADLIHTLESPRMPPPPREGFPLPRPAAPRGEPVPPAAEPPPLLEVLPEPTAAAPAATAAPATPAAPAAPATPATPATPASPTEATAPTPPPPAAKPERPVPAATPARPTGEPLQWKEVPPVPPPLPRQPLWQVLGAFLEQKNIRWGELVGGLLIIGCSAALVLSLWNQIAAIPVLKFFIFTGVTAALFGVGLYTRHKWKLPTTSSGVLITSTLLVPLNFLAIAAFSEGTGGLNPAVVGGEALAIALFAWLTFLGARITAPPWPLATTVAVVGSSACQLLIRRLASPEMPDIAAWALAGVPLALYYVPVLRTTLVCRQWKSWDRVGANAVFVLLGASSFATLLAVGLLLSRLGPFHAALDRLPLLVLLLGFPPLLLGLEIWRGLAASTWLPQRVAGTSIAIAGAFVLVAGLGLAWPAPGPLLVGSLVTALALFIVALTHGAPQAQLPAGLCAGLAGLLAFHLLGDRLGWSVESAWVTLEALGSGSSGPALTVLAVAIAGGCRVFLRREMGAQALWLGIASGVLAAASLLLVSWRGLGRADDSGACILYALHAAGALAATWRYRHSAPAWIGSALLLLALLQGLAHTFAGTLQFAHPFLTALELHATVCVLLSPGMGSTHPSRALALSALPTSCVAIVATAGQLSIPLAAELWPHVLWTAAIWGVLAWRFDSRTLLSFATVALSLCVVVAITANCAAREWFLRGRDPLLHPWTLQSQGIGLVAVLALIWGCRETLDRWRPGELVERARRLLRPPGLWVEGVLAALPSLVLAGLAVSTVIPGLGEEFATSAEASDRWFGDARHLLARGAGAWILWGSLVLLWLGQLWHHFDRARLAAVVLTGAAGCFLLAGRWEGDGAVASALRWLLAGYWVALSAAVLASRGRVPSGRGTVRLTAVLITSVPLVFLTLIPVGMALDGQRILGPARATFFAGIGNEANYLLPLALLATGMIGHALRDGLVRYAFSAGAVIHLATSLGYLMVRVGAGEEPRALEFLLVNATAAAGWSLACLLIHRVRPGWLGSLPHRVGAPLALALLAAATLAGLACDAIDETATVSAVTRWVAAAAVAALMLARVGERESRFAAAGLWATGLVTLLTALDAGDLDIDWLVWSLMLALPCFSALAGALFSWQGSGGRSPPWLVACHAVLVGFAAILALWVVTTYPAARFEHALALRLGAAASVLVSALALGLLDRSRQVVGIGAASLTLVALAALFFGWALLDPGGEAVIGHRSAVTMVALVAVAGIYAVGLARAGEILRAWARPARWLSGLQLGVAAVSLVVTLAVEIHQVARYGSVALAGWAIALVFVALVAVTALLLFLAVSPGRDPFHLSERGRMAYVYLAELALVALFVHVRLTVPWLFHGFFQRYWPLAVMGIAFAGVGLGEWFRRRGLLVLATPLRHTGALLPLLPVLAYWAGDIEWAGSAVPYSLQLTAVGLLYGLLSVARKSYGFGMLAALAMNGGLWYFLHQRSGLGFVDHPQLWLIPLALTVLGASHLNRHALTENQMVLTRYVCLMLVYVSSTADVFLHGISGSVWLPVILMTLSVAGVLLGILLRIRSFLFLGSGFLLLSLIAIVWSASERLDITWLWYVAGILLGTAIIALFAVFEKKRQEILRVVDQLREWNG